MLGKRSQSLSRVTGFMYLFMGQILKDVGGCRSWSSAETHARGSCYLLQLLVTPSAAPHSSASWRPAQRRGLSAAISSAGFAVLAFLVGPISPINFYSNNAGQGAIT